MSIYIKIDTFWIKTGEFLLLPHHPSQSFLQDVKQ